MKKLIDIQGDKKTKCSTYHNLLVKSAEEGKNPAEKIRELIEIYANEK
jgi:hypothetical protein